MISIIAFKLQGHLVMFPNQPFLKFYLHVNYVISFNKMTNYANNTKTTNNKNKIKYSYTYWRTNTLYFHTHSTIPFPYHYLIRHFTKGGGDLGDRHLLVGIFFVVK